MYFSLKVEASSLDEAEAYARVLTDRGVKCTRQGKALNVFPLSPDEGGIAVLKGFIRWADNAQLEVSINGRPSRLLARTFVDQIVGDCEEGDLLVEVLIVAAKLASHVKSLSEDNFQLRQELAELQDAVEVDDEV
jgi:hypothetical protein